MRSKTFKEKHEEDSINDTITISKEYNLTKFRVSCGRNGYVKFTNAQIKSIINYLQELIE